MRAHRFSCLVGRVCVSLFLAQALSAGLAEANGPPIQTETAFTTGLNGSALRTFVRLSRQTGERGEMRVLTFAAVVPHEVIDNTLILGMVLPLVDKRLRQVEGGERSAGPGLGDLNVFGKVNLYQLDRHRETFRVAGKLSTTLPTGLHDASDVSGRLPAGLQRGAGSVNPSVSLIATWIRQRVGFNADLGFIARTEVAGLDPGDILQYNLAASYRILPSVFEIYPDHQISLMMELNGTLSRKTRFEGERSSDSGGHVLFASPGVQYMYGGLIVETSLQLPIPELTKLNGKQPVPDWTASLGLRWLLN